MGIRRKIEVYRLTISGLPEGLSYTEFLSKVRKAARSQARIAYVIKSKTRILKDLVVHDDRMQIRFLSYNAGIRPDMLDTESYKVVESPLTATQIPIEWTHILGGVVRDRFLLLVEKYQGSVYGAVIEQYLQKMIDDYPVLPQAEESGPESMPIVVSVEAEASDIFVQRVEGLTRVRKASLRMVRPNPGWKDLQSDLAAESQESDAHKTEITMFARRGGTLARAAGIVGAILANFRDRKLDYAALEGEVDGRAEKVSTKEFAQFHWVNVELDERGLIDENDAWDQLGKLMDGIK